MIGRLSLTWRVRAIWIGLVLLPVSAYARPGEFTATVDRSSIALDESVQLKFTLQRNTAGGIFTNSGGNPRFEAPDFDVINSYQSNYTNSTYSNGQFDVVHTQQMNFVLRPKKQGKLKITRIEMEANGETYHAPDLAVDVSPGGARTQPPPGYGGNSGLRATGKRGDPRPFFVRAEVNHDKVYKGQQIIISYYIYSKVRILRPGLTQIPALNGFLKEELGGLNGAAMSWEQVVLDGTSYQRALVARYAAYPLKEGSLEVDPLGVEASYVSTRGTGFGMDDDDPFLQFFQQLTPQVSVQKSDPLRIHVEPLPEAGKPPTFTGGVGEFTVEAAIDKTEVKANEAITLTLKIEGRGNLSNIEINKIPLPPTMDLYESKGRMNTGRSGIGQKIFDFLIIPREAGEFDLPSVSLGFFDPVKQQYVTQTTAPVHVRVLPNPGSSPPSSARLGNSAIQDQPSAAAPKAPTQPSDDIDLQWLFSKSFAKKLGLGFGVFLGLILLTLGAVVIRKKWADFRKKAAARARANRDRRWAKFSAELGSEKKLNSWDEIRKKSEDLEELLFSAIEESFKIPVRAIPREAWHKTIVESQAMPVAEAQILDQALSLTELIRFAGPASGLTPETAREKLLKACDQVRPIFLRH